MGKRDDEAHEQLRQDRRQDVREGEPQPGRPRRLREPQVRLVAHLGGLGAQQAREAPPVRERDRERHAPEPAAQGIAHQDQEHDVRDAHHEVDEPAHDGIGSPAAQRRDEREHERDGA